MLDLVLISISNFKKNISISNFEKKTFLTFSEYFLHLMCGFISRNFANFINFGYAYIQCVYLLSFNKLQNWEIGESNDLEEQSFLWQISSDLEHVSNHFQYSISG